MLHPRTEAAVLAAPLADLREHGLGTDRCHVLVGADGPDIDDAELVRQLVAASDRCLIREDAAWDTFSDAWTSASRRVAPGRLAEVAVSLLGR
jgi:hypothetical protein